MSHVPNLGSFGLFSQKGPHRRCGIDGRRALQLAAVFALCLAPSVGAFDNPQVAKVEEDYLPDIDRILEALDRALTY